MDDWSCQRHAQVRPIHNPRRESLSGRAKLHHKVIRLIAGNCSGGWLAATCSGDREVAVNEVANGAEGGLSGEARGAGDGAIPGVDLSPPF